MNYRSRYGAPRYGRQKPKATNYLMPFVILIALGIILILLFNLWKAIFSNDDNNGIYMHIVDGSAQLRTWGTDDFFDLSADALIVQGDEVKTSSEGRVIFEFFDGSILRIDGGSDVIFETVDEGKNETQIKVIVVDGKAWINKVYKDTSSTDFIVTMNNVVVTSSASHIFEVENEFDEAVRVLAGSDLQIDILSEEDKKVVETEKLGVGQEIVFTDKVLARFWEFQSPTVIASLADEFKQSDWYLWNLEEDSNPSELNKSIGDPDGTLVKAPPEVMEDEEEVPVDDVEDLNKDETDTEVDSETDTEAVVETPDDSASKPTVTSVAGVSQPDSDGFYQVKSRVATLTGNVPAGAVQVVVNGFTLSKFKPGDTTWTYFANADFDLMSPGENTYEVYSIDADGVKSGTLTFKVFYTQQAAAPAPEESASADT